VKNTVLRLVLDKPRELGNFYVGNVDSPQFGQPSGQLLTPPRQAQVGARLAYL
jgi:hypothetical protein